MKKKLILIVTGLMVLLFLLSACASKESRLDVDLSLGYQGLVKISEGNPFLASINNYGEELNGELQILVKTNQGQALIFAKEFQIPANGEKDISMVIPLSTIQAEFEVTILDGHKVIYEDVVKPTRFISPYQPVIAVITDRPDDYKFLKSAEFNEYLGEQMMVNTYRNSLYPREDTYVEKKDPEVFYFESFDEIKAYDNLDFFNYIYFGDHTNLKLGDQMEDKLLSWVSQGGSIIMETGDDYKRTYSFIPDSISNFSVSSLDEIYVDTLFDKYPVEDKLKLAIGSPIDDSHVSYYSEKGLNYVMYTPIGSGQVINLLMDLSQEGIQSKSFRSQLLDEVLAKGIGASSLSIAQGDAYYNGGQYSYMLGTIPVDKNPPYLFMFLLFSLYILLVGPIFYIIFKKKDQRDKIWIAIPMASLSCILILYLFGFGTRYNKPIINSITKMNYSDGDDFATLDSQLAIFNNESGDLTINWAHKDKLSKVHDQYYAYNNNDTLRIVGKRTTGQRETFDLYDTGLWAKTDFTIEKTIPMSIEEEGPFVLMTIEGENLELDVYNKTNLDLKTAFLNWNGNYIYVGDLDAKDRITLRTKMSALTSEVYTMFDQVRSENGWSSYGGKISETEQNIDFLTNVFSQQAYSFTGKDKGNTISLIGLNKSPVGYDIQVNDQEPDQYNKNIISISSQLNFTAGMELTLPAGMVEPEVKAGNSEASLADWPLVDNYKVDQTVRMISIYRENLLECNFTIPDYIESERVSLKVAPAYLDNDYYQGNELDPTMALEGVDYEIYNYKSQSYDEVTVLDDFYSLDLNQYMDKGYIQLRYRMNVDRRMDLQDSIVLEAPMILIEGRAK